MTIYQIIHRPLVTEKGVDKKDNERTLFSGYRSEWKKAYVKLKEGQKVPEFAEI